MLRIPISRLFGWTMPEQGALLRVVTDSLPNVTGIRVQDVLMAIAALLNQIAAALTATGALALAGWHVRADRRACRGSA